MLPAPIPRDLHIAIIGGGLMGHALAATMLDAGADVAVFESLPTLRATLASRMQIVLSELEAEPTLASKVHLLTALNQLDPRTHLVIEAIPEDLPLKQQLFADLERLLPNAVLASNSSVYRVGDIAAKTKNAERILGTHWWNPPHLVPIVEVIQGGRTAAEAVDWTLAVLKMAGKQPVRVHKDTAGFIGNRLQHALWREALAMVEEGVADAETVDAVARGTLGLKLATLGPIENADYVGLDLTRAIHDYIFPTLCSATEVSPLIKDAISHNQLGAKSGKGLLDWPASRRPRLADRLAANIRQQLKNQAKGQPE